MPSERMGSVAGARGLEAIARDARHAGRALRRAPRFALAVLLALALGTGIGAALLPLARGGISHPQPVESPPGIEVPSARAGGYTDPPALARLFGSGAGFAAARRSAAEVQRESLADLLRTLGAAALLAVALACLSAGLLLLARGAARRREIAIRGALGATRRRLLAQLLTEGAALGGGGACLGIILGAAGIWLLRLTWPEGLAPWFEGAVPMAPVALAVALPLLAALGFGLAPLRARREGSLLAGLGSGGRATAGPAEGRLRRRLTIAAVASSLALLTGAGILLRGFSAQETVGASFADSSDTLTLYLEAPRERYPDAAARASAYEALLDRVAAVPGVRAESLSSPGAWVGLGTEELVHALTGQPMRPGIVRPARYHAVSPGYFRAMGVPMVAGREFSRADRVGSPGVVIVNETFARRLLPRLDPVGRQVQLGGMSLGGRFYTVVGVVPDLRVPGPGAGSVPVPAVYLAALQAPPPQVGIAVRTTGDPLDALPEVERALATAAPDLRASSPMSLERRLARFGAPLRWLAASFGALALLVTLLAAFGLYGVVSYAVAQRTREIGIRMAVGAPAGRVVRLVVREGVRLAATGAAVGVAGALCLGRLLQYLFHGVDPLDPLVYGAAALLLGCVAVLGSYGPARTAARVDPVIALRSE